MISDFRVQNKIFNKQAIAKRKSVSNAYITMEEVQRVRNKHPIFNGEYQIVKSLGEGNTSKVYLARSNETGALVAIKILKDEFLRRDNDSILSVHNEITILKNLTHEGIVGMLGYGDSGDVVKPSGRHIKNLVFITMEYVSGGLLFDLC